MTEEVKTHYYVIMTVVNAVNKQVVGHVDWRGDVQATSEKAAALQAFESIKAEFYPGIGGDFSIDSCTVLKG